MVPPVVRREKSERTAVLERASKDGSEVRRERRVNSRASEPEPARDEMGVSPPGTPCIKFTVP